MTRKGRAVDHFFSAHSRPPSCVLFFPPTLTLSWFVTASRPRVSILPGADPVYASYAVLFPISRSLGGRTANFSILFLWLSTFFVSCHRDLKIRLRGLSLSRSPPVDLFLRRRALVPPFSGRTRRKSPPLPTLLSFFLLGVLLGSDQDPLLWPLTSLAFFQLLTSSPLFSRRHSFGPPLSFFFFSANTFTRRYLSTDLSRLAPSSSEIPPSV